MFQNPKLKWWLFGCTDIIWYLSEWILKTITKYYSAASQDNLRLFEDAAVKKDKYSWHNWNWGFKAPLLRSTNNINSNGNGNLVEKTLQKSNWGEKVETLSNCWWANGRPSWTAKIAFDHLNSQDWQTITLNPDYLWGMCKIYVPYVKIVHLKIGSFERKCFSNKFYGICKILL